MKGIHLPKHISKIEQDVEAKLKLIPNTSTELYENKQVYVDQMLQVYQEAFTRLIDKTITFSNLLRAIKNSYDDALEIRNQRISHYVVQQRVFGTSAKEKEYGDKLKKILKENEDLREQNIKLILEVSKAKKEMGKTKDEDFSDYLALMRERDARYTLYFENLSLHMKLKELDGSNCADVSHGDPVILRIALERCRKQLATTQIKLAKMTDEYAETVPRRDFESLESKYNSFNKTLESLQKEHDDLKQKYKKTLNQKKSTEVELIDIKDRCTELERAGTPRPRWELCADFIGGGRDRWRQLASGLSSRDTLLVVLKELGPAAESDHLEHFDGLGMDPMIPPYLRYEGKVRNLRLSRREISVIINDVWLGKLQNGNAMSMQDYLTNYFNDRYQQTSVRAEWAYNLCSSAEQMLDESQVKLFWGVLHGHLSEDIYWGLRTEWHTLKDNLYKLSKDGETLTLDDFEKVAKATFPLKTEVEIKNMSDVVKKQLKMKINTNEINLDKLLQENEEGFDRIELARELYRQRQICQDKYIREIVAELGGKNAANKMISVENLKRAFAIVDPAIDHIRMERNIRWAFSDQTSDLKDISPLPLRALAVRLAAGDIERVGPRYTKGTKRRNVVK